MAPLDIAIVGNGIAGAAAALFLRRAGHRIARFERCAADAPGGAALLLQPPAIAVLRAAGLDSRMWSLGEPVDHLAAHFVESGQSIRLDYAQFGATVRACGILRAALLRVLDDANDDREQIHWSTPIADVDLQAGTLHSTDTRAFGPFDLIVAADGAQSAIRSRCPQLLVHERAYRDAAIVCLVDNPHAMFGAGVIQHFHAGSHVSTWPAGALVSGGTKRITIALRTDIDALARLAGNPSLWLAAIDRIHPPLADFIRSAPRQPELLPYTYREVVTHRYHAQRVVLIGDAAHAMSPQLGLGASLGLLDAWYLAKCLSSPVSMTQALSVFDRERRSHVASLQNLSRLVTPLFQSDHPVLAMLRERSTLLFGRSDMLKRHALATLCEIPRELL
jgi:2-polyprenyl-6-methoxyphenol hydroxylase-like FAD-dependent oxidoreductase